VLQVFWDIHHVDGQIVTSVLKDHSCFIFQVKQSKHRIFAEEEKEMKSSSG
jgi:predicted TIM-barrel enzyme